MLKPRFPKRIDHALPTENASKIRPRADAMRMIYLLLAFFVLTGIGATCRTPTIQAASDCGADQTTAECAAGTVPDAGS